MSTRKDYADWVARVLDIKVDAGDAEVAPLDLKSLGLEVGDVWQAAHAAYDQATETVNRQLTALQAALRESDDPELHDIADYLADVANAGLNAFTGGTRVPLMAAMLEAGNGDPAALKAAAPKLRKAVDAFRKRIETEPHIAACDNNPFGVDVSIVATYAGALDQVEYAAGLV